MKTYDERYDDVVRKMERLEKKRRTKRKVIGASCLLLAVAVLAMVLFVPYSTAAPNVSQYSGSPYYSLIQRINEATYQKPEFKNNFEMLTNGVQDMNGGLKGEIIYEGAGVNDELGIPEPDSNAGNYVEVTDNQVQGVIEADIIKRSDRYIYYLRSDVLTVYSIDGPDSKEIGRYTIAGDETVWHGGELEMYLSQDCATITLVGNCYSKEDKTTYVCVTNLDVTDPGNIRESGRIYLSGSSLSSRKVGEDLLLLSSFRIAYDYDFSDESTFLPQIGQPGNMVSVAAADILAPEELSSTRYTVVCKLDGKTLEVKGSAAFLSYSDQIYVSEDNVFVTRGFTVKEDGYASRLMTEISCLNYSGENLEYKGSVTVEGFVKNQYSMDEYKGILRVVTSVRNTLESVSGSTASASWERNASLFCISLEDFSIAASVEKFAPAGEQAESVRFDGDNAYVCTAEVIVLTDPVYFFDLSDLDNITYKDTGTIPGYSSSLVNFGDGYLLGIGYGEDRGLKIEVYEETADGVASVCAYEAGAAFPEEYKSYLIDRENRMIGLGMHNWEIGECRYILLLFDGYELRELVNVPMDVYDLGNTRAVLIEDYLYILNADLQVEKVW
ncbi:MAG: beta-propeller domain-containing protein [Oscillospiraceae bacterium]|nr:beta-propeller domain-containing protein [Oscillospiraceae bacterium]